ncbi:MAG: sigma-54 dependent transcriptional regulator [Cytophagales bacterium]|nr:sigma-54 dependent transcriptional regulator [Bernardetiaceae bacterium]MDW8210952.1 sigma-54 dependent transcriptional regulator [Cytophagales bacterium]
MPKVLIVDDEKSVRYSLREILEYEKYEVDEAKDGEEGLEKLKAEDYDVCLCDIKMPKMDGIEVLEKAMELGKNTQFIMISAHGTIETAVEATKKGAYDFISKPPDLNRLLVTIRNALDKSSLVEETRTLRKKIISKTSSRMIGESEALQKVREMINKVAPTEARVLITGPNGSGKELVARAIHELSNRASGPLIEVNCAAIPSELIESELFGHEKGSFTSAIKQRIGKFELANGGTLFLDEIGDMSLSAQAKVLRALQEHKITRVGGDKEIKINVRVVAATNKDLKEEIKQGRFREDLYHRLSVIVIHVPPLKERKEDIPLLVDYFLQEIAEDYGAAKKSITPEAIAQLQTYEWTGNIRELRNVVERLVIMGGQQITAEDVRKYV